MKRTDPLRLSAEAAISNTLRLFLGRGQLACVRKLFDEEEGEWFARKMIELDSLISAMPKVYEQDGNGDDAVVYLHYFAGGAANWWITEKDSEPGRQDQAFGLANLFGGPNEIDAELGYISIAEIIQSGGELDFHFTPRTLRQLKAGEQPSAVDEAVRFIRSL